MGADSGPGACPSGKGGARGARAGLVERWQSGLQQASGGQYAVCRVVPLPEHQLLTSTYSFATNP